MSNELITIDNKKYFWDCFSDSLVLLEDEQIVKSNDNDDVVVVDNDYINKKTQDEWYMDLYDMNFWKGILGRKLYSEEKMMFYSIWNENSLNTDIKMLQKNILKYNCYIKCITDNVGNCLFESLASLGLGDNDFGIDTHKMLRKNIGSVLLLTKTEINFFPNINLTPEEIFNNINEIEFVKDNVTGKVYEYDFNMMILDLTLNYSWKRLPTEFILMAISRIYEVEILVYHNKSNYIHKINVCNNYDKNYEKIRLGLINEEHYFPLLELPQELINDPDVIKEILNKDIKYTKSINKFKKWSKLMYDSINTNTNYDNFVSSENKIENNKNNQKIMVTDTKLSNELIEDYNQISNFEDFEII